MRLEEYRTRQQWPDSPKRRRYKGVRVIWPTISPQFISQMRDFTFWAVAAEGPRKTAKNWLHQDFGLDKRNTACYK